MLCAGDHIANLPFTLIGDENGQHIFQLHAPAQAESYLRQYIAALFEVNALSSEVGTSSRTWYEWHGYDSPTSVRVELNKSLFRVDVILCDHSIPTLSYCFSTLKQKLKEEYVGYSGKEIAALRRSGVEVTREVCSPAFAFICDTSIAVLQTYPHILPSYPLVIIECTFLYPEELDNAIATKHIHWTQLKPYVLAHPQCLFVLIHFSLRYKEQEVLDFFRQERKDALALTQTHTDAQEETNSDMLPLHNIKVWAGDTSIDPFAHDDYTDGPDSRDVSVGAAAIVDHESFSGGRADLTSPMGGGCACCRGSSRGVGNSSSALRNAQYASSESPPPTSS